MGRLLHRRGFFVRKRHLIAVLSLLVCAACEEQDSGDQSGNTDDDLIQGDDDDDVLPGQAGHVLARLTFPNGDPMPRATLSIAGSVESVTTGLDGSFDLPCEGNQRVEIDYKAGFSGSVSGTCGAASQVIAIDRKDASRIAIIESVTAVDAVYNTLAEMGFAELMTDEGWEANIEVGTAEWDYYWAPESEDPEIVGVEELLHYPSRMADYDMIIIEGNAINAVDLTYITMSNLTEWVDDGGRLVVTGSSYDWVEQLFPEKVNFVNSDQIPAGTGEVPFLAEVGWHNGGAEDGVVSAFPADPDLADWMASTPGILPWSEGNCTAEGPSSLTDDGAMPIGNLHNGFPVITGAHNGSDMKVWVEGQVKFTDLGTEEAASNSVRPLAVTFHAGQGSVLYSSYWTAYDCSLDQGFTPEERAFQYLAFSSNW